MMDTGVIQIGNSDDKLTQGEWSRFVVDVQNLLSNWNCRIYFQGASASSAPWQNACWVFEIKDSIRLDVLRGHLRLLADRYRQDSIALTLGDTEFVKFPG